MSLFMWETTVMLKGGGNFYFSTLPMYYTYSLPFLYQRVIWINLGLPSIRIFLIFLREHIIIFLLGSICNVLVADI